MKCVGIDLGGTKILAGVMDEEGQVLEICERPTPTVGDAIFEALVDIVKHFQQHHEISAVGIGTPGQVSFPDGKILGCTPNLKQWQGRELGKGLSSAVQCGVRVDNDANTATIAELKVGSGLGLSDFVMLTLGTGLGSGNVSGGRLSRGYHDLGIGYGHMIVERQGRYCNCGQQGCLEAYVSGKGIQKTYRLKGGAFNVTSPDIFRRALQGEPLAQETLDLTLDMLATGIVNIFNTVAPQAVILGGGISRQGENVLLNPLREKVAGIMGMPFQTPQSICLAALGSDAGMIGAGLLAFDSL